MEVVVGIDPLLVSDALWVVGEWAAGNVSRKDSLVSMALSLGAESFCSVGGVALSLGVPDSDELLEGVKAVADAVCDGRALSVNVGKIPGK